MNGSGALTICWIPSLGKYFMLTYYIIQCHHKGELHQYQQVQQSQRYMSLGQYQREQGAENKRQHISQPFVPLKPDAYLCLQSEQPFQQTPHALFPAEPENEVHRYGNKEKIDEEDNAVKQHDEHYERHGYHDADKTWNLFELYSPVVKKYHHIFSRMYPFEE